MTSHEDSAASTTTSSFCTSPVEPVLWTGALAEGLPEFEWSEVVSDPSARLAALRALRDLGFALVRGDPTDDDGIKEMAAIIGPLVPSAYGTIWSLKPEGSKTVGGNTTKHLAPHTDEAYRHDPPGIRILYCVTPAESGGEVELVDGFTVAARLEAEEPEAFAVLRSVRQPFERVVREDGIDQRTLTRSIVVGDDGEVIGLRFQTVSVGPMEGAVTDPASVQAANELMLRLTIDPDLMVTTRLLPGDAVFFDNHRVLHARRAFTDPARHHQISTVSRENFHQALRTTAFSLGFETEAEQYLSAGLLG